MQVDQQSSFWNLLLLQNIQCYNRIDYNALKSMTRFYLLGKPMSTKCALFALSVRNTLTKLHVSISLHCSALVLEGPKFLNLKCTWGFACSFYTLQFGL